MERPKESELTPPWEIVDCTCKDGCRKCDGARWYYHNPETGQHVSEMMRDALERHG